LTTYKGDSKVKLNLRDGNSDDTIVIRRGWLPMAVWEGVRVLVTSTRGLTLFERFAIECLLALGECSKHDLFEVASLPAELSDRIMSSLAERDLARQVSPGCFVPHIQNCETALTQGSLPVESEERLTFLWFPETEEFVCLAKAETLLKQLRNTEPVGRFPLPECWKRVKKSKALTDALQEQRVYGHDFSAMSFAADDSVIEHELCPAYYCSTTLPTNSEGHWKLTLKGDHQSWQQDDATQGDASDRKWEPSEIEFTVPVVPHLVQHWRSRLVSETRNIAAECASVGLGRLSFNGSSFQASIDEHSAKKMAQQRLLANHLTLDVTIDSEIDFSVSMRISPADDPTEQLFALDDAVRRLLSLPDAAEAISSLCDGRPFGRQDVLNRLWQLKLFGTLYEIRESEDFRE